MRQRLTAVILNLLLVACTSIGPATVPHDRIDYGSSIGNSWKEQTLLNIVKLRYADMPIFLEVAQVIAGYQLQSALSGSFTLGNFTASLIDRLIDRRGNGGQHLYRPTHGGLSTPHRGRFPEAFNDADSAKFRAVHAPVRLLGRADHADHVGLD
jgi:hypothetical protein